MSVAAGAPELLSQVKEQIIAGARMDSTGHSGESNLRPNLERARIGPHEDVSDRTSGSKSKDDTTQHEQQSKPVYMPKWPREPLNMIHKSLQEWVKFAELLEVAAVERTENPALV